MKGRRSLIQGAALLGLLARSPAFAQQANRLPRIARISSEAPLADLVGPDPVSPQARAFVHGLRNLGWVDGRNLVIEHRSAEGRPDRLPALLRELLALPVDLIVTGGGAAARAARQASDTTPIVSIGPDPVVLGFASSYARPGGNVTGLTFSPGNTIFGKRLEMLKQAVPKARRIAVIAARPISGRPDFSADTAAAARALGLELSLVAADGPADFDAAFAEIARKRPDAIIGQDSPLNLGNRARIMAFAARERLPAIFGLRAFAESGALMSYGIDLPDMERRAALYVDKILKGAKPGELPIEQPTRYELIINLKVAAALGIKIPQELLLVADDLIQ